MILPMPDYLPTTIQSSLTRYLKSIYIYTVYVGAHLASKYMDDNGKVGSKNEIAN